MVQKGIKTIELRLYDEKRKLLSVGDTIIFTNADNPSSTLSCIIAKLHKFSNFNELYNTLPLEKCGYTPNELQNANAKDMEKYYTQEEQRLYGVVGIEIIVH